MRFATWPTWPCAPARGRVGGCPAASRGPPGRESWLTVTAALGADEPWAPARHLAGWGQARITPPSPPATPSLVPAQATTAGIRIGEALFHPASGALLRLGDMAADPVTPGCSTTPVTDCGSKAIRSSTYQCTGGRQKPLLCGGTIVVDAGKVIDAYPALDHLATIEQLSLSTGGPGLNMAVDLRMLGARFPIAMLGAVGDDEHAAFILAECARLGIDTAGVRTLAGAVKSFTDAMIERTGGRRSFSITAGTARCSTPRPPICSTHEPGYCTQVPRVSTCTHSA